ncbi:MAG: hypothetical protein JWR63_3150 [Conexibacter sp.]|jgi:hypothetical protein|nr:hypothetical protein [Conexibacter sp.]
MNGAQHGAEGDDSKGTLPARPFRSGFPGVFALRGVLAATGLAGAVLLALATVTAVIRITVGTAARTSAADAAGSGWDRHGPALLVLMLLALWLLAGALRGSTVAKAGLAVVGAAALGIAIVADRPHIHDPGAAGDVYAEATARPGIGYYLETLGGALLLVSGGALLALGEGGAPRPAHNDDGRPLRSGRRTEA